MYIYIYMVSKNISLKEESYSSLVALKRPDESFSDEILRLTNKKTGEELKGVIGLWKNMGKNEMNELEEGIKKSRIKMAKILGKWSK